MGIYNKPALTFDEQIDLLISRGLIVNDRVRTKRHLSNVSYYRLSAYMLPFKQKDDSGKILDNFNEETTWDNVYDLYKFDRKLRLLVFDAIERIEISLRTQVIYQLSHKYGSHWQDCKVLFKPAKFDYRTQKTYDVYNEVQKHIQDELSRNKVVFIEHYSAKYSEPKNPPSWMCIELLYFSELSKICKNLARRSDRIAISKAFGINNDEVFCSWLHTLNYIRNLCAHHARLWNIYIDITPQKYYSNSSKIWLSNENVETIQRSKLYYTLCIILYFLQTVNPKTKFKRHFDDLLQEYPIVNVGNMGFPENWREHPLWKISQ